MCLIGTSQMTAGKCVNEIVPPSRICPRVVLCHLINHVFEKALELGNICWTLAAGIHVVHGPVENVRVEVISALEVNRVFVEKSSRLGIVVSGAIVRSTRDPLDRVGTRVRSHSNWPEHG